MWRKNGGIYRSLKENIVGRLNFGKIQGFYAVRLGGENDLLRRLEDCLSENGSTKKNKNKVAVVQVIQKWSINDLNYP